MNIVVDTSVWSLVLRRHKIDENNPFVTAFKSAVHQGHTIHLLGNILQELLDGVDIQSFDRLLTLLKPFPLLLLMRETYIHASELRNVCRKKGIQASSVDFLITAACIENGYPLLTSDKDFRHIAKHSSLIVI